MVRARLIQPSHRFIQEHDVWNHGHGASDGDSLGLAARELVRAALGKVAASYFGQLGKCALSGRATLDPRGLEAERHVLHNSHVGEEKWVLLEDDDAGVCVMVRGVGACVGRSR